MIDAEAIILHFYPEDNELRQLLLLHSRQVAQKALDILHEAKCVRGDMRLEDDEVTAAAMLHDIGIGCCHAPSIFCVGKEPYIAHGIIGARRLEEYGAEHAMNLVRFARVCARHTGAGISEEERRAQNLPIPSGDYLPETLLEKLICLADKFFSKSNPRQEKSLAQARKSLEKFGDGTLKRFDSMCNDFQVQ